MPAETVVVRILQDIGELHIKANFDGVPFFDLMNIDYDDVLALEQAGAVSVRGDGFGAAIVSTAASMTKYISVMSYGQPGLVSQSDLACYGSKLDLIMWPLRAGWAPTKKPRPHKLAVIHV